MNAVGSGFPAPAESICWYAEITPAGVVIFAESHPIHWGSVQPSGGHALGFFPARPLPGGWGGNTGAGVTYLMVEQADLELPEPTNTSPDNWKASCIITGNLVTEIWGQEEFKTVDHTDILHEVR